MTQWNGRVEQSVLVRAAAAQVWALVSVPGWFISGRPGAPEVQKVSEGLTIVHDDVMGQRAIRTLELDKPSYAAFRWEVPGDLVLTATLIEFWVTEQEAGTVLLKVRESGLSAGPAEGDEDLRSRRENTEGWRAALAAVVRFFE